MSEELRRLAKTAIIGTITNEGQPGVLGRADGTLYFTDAAGVIHRDRIWCRIGQGDSPTEVVVDCTGVPRQYNLPVIVANRNGRPTAIRTDATTVNHFTGGRQIDVTEHAWMHGRFGGDPLYITGPAFMPLMAVPSNPPAMTVQVREGFYRYQGIEKVFLTQTSGSLSAHIPASALQQKFVVLSINRSTNALTVTAGTSIIAPTDEVAPFSATEVLAIMDDLADEHYPIAAVRLYNGQTRITAPDIFMDLRLWGGEYNSVAESVPWHTHRMSVDSGTRTIAAGYSLVVPDFEIPAGTVLEIAAGGVLMVIG